MNEVWNGIEKLGVISGTGNLPNLILEEAAIQDVACYKVIPNHLEKSLNTNGNLITFSLFDLTELFEKLRALGITTVVFAGSINRPLLNESSYAVSCKVFRDKLLPFLTDTDDNLLTRVCDLFKDENFNLISSQKLLKKLTLARGLFSRSEPTNQDLYDMEKAIEFQKILGKTDIGQGLVVAQGLCIAVETIPGTDAMLQFVGKHISKFLINPNGSKGVFYKAPKKNQSQMIDMPTIGVETIRRVFEAKLGGLAICANSVLVIDKNEVILEADKLGLFFVSR